MKLGTLQALRDFCKAAGIHRARIYLHGQLVRIRVPADQVDRLRWFVARSDITGFYISVRRLWPIVHDDVRGYTAMIVLGENR